MALYLQYKVYMRATFATFSDRLYLNRSLLLPLLPLALLDVQPVYFLPLLFKDFNQVFKSERSSFFSFFYSIKKQFQRKLKSLSLGILTSPIKGR
jgi:hypothetical protein